MPNEKRPAVSDRAPSTTSTLHSNDTNVATARSVSWWSVHEYVQPVLTRIGDYPPAGTPAWCELADGDPRKVAAIFDYAQHHALRVETAQEIHAEASKAVAAAADWPAIANELHQLHTWRSTRPWAIRQSVNHA